MMSILLQINDLIKKMRCIYVLHPVYYKGIFNKDIDLKKLKMKQNAFHYQFTGIMERRLNPEILCSIMDSGISFHEQVSKK